MDNLTPFGEYMGQSNNTYTNFKAGAQDPKWFSVKNVTTCPQSNNCDSDSVRQMHRLSLGRKTDFFAYVQRRRPISYTVCTGGSTARLLPSSHLCAFCLCRAHFRARAAAAKKEAKAMDVAAAFFDAF